ncbi:helix-turn-helix transcriptional regulator [Paenibacillus sedimenti]|uniref:YafY family transcriptional regulator n=1 Tax=Paenibacillus sedimenti TaxID=2770274 RepID=A0A926QK28_9BACL|nr:YafY family protein [Paenibacillus sedimenti]MBD0382165.1 YafY family transcriptional regulator [Paenibacillus sedimenti]
MNKTQRLIELLLTMNTRQKFTLKELAERFGVTRRTVLRDLDELSALGVPLYAELGVHGGYRILKERTLPPISFSEKEAVALFFASQSLQFYRALPMESDWQSALAKFYHVLPDDVKERIDKLQRRLLFWVPAQTWETAHLPALLEGAIEQRVLRISYESETGRRERNIQLIGLYAMNGKWYCPAYDFRSSEYRLFRADRILSVTDSPDQTMRKNHDKLLIADWFSKDQEREENVAEFELKVQLTRRGVLLCSNDAWLGSGLTVKEDGSGYISRRISSGYMTWAASFFVSCRGDAIVEEPQELRRMIRDQLRELITIYEEE